MLTSPPTDEALYAALSARDAAYDGHAFVGVTTTGIFCKLTCPARKPNAENTRFFASAAACLAAGFRACLRCRPRDPMPAAAGVIDAQLDAGYGSGSRFRQAVLRLIGETPAHLRGRELLKADWIETPIGPLLAVADRHALHLLEFFDRKALPTELQRLRKTTRSGIGFGRSPPIDRIEAELHHYFDGRSATFTTPLARHGSMFTRTVWQASAAIPLGTTEFYGSIAARLGRPSAVRAVARSNGANQIAIVIPCHRVIGADGALTGYGGGLWRKRWLIEHERRTASIIE